MKQKKSLCLAPWCVSESNLLIESVSSQENSLSLLACLKQAVKTVILFFQKERKTEGIKAAPRRGVETDPPGVSVHLFSLSEKRRRFFPSLYPANIFSNFKYTTYQLWYMPAYQHKISTRDTNRINHKQKGKKLRHLISLFNKISKLWHIWISL